MKRERKFKIVQGKRDNSNLVTFEEPRRKKVLKSKKESYYDYPCEQSDYTNDSPCCTGCKNDDCKCPDPCGKYKQVNIVSDIGQSALNQDVSLINPWGIVVLCDKVWVSVNEASKLTSYTKTGELIQNVTVPGGNSTGLVVNCTKLFKFPVGDPAAQPALLITVTKNGTIDVYNPNVNPNTAVTVFTAPADTSNYTGVTIHKGFLYVTDFFAGLIRKFDGSFNLVASFTDTSLSTIGYYPFNVYSDGCKLYVAFALSETAEEETTHTTGLGFGYVDVFKSDSSYRRLIDRDGLNAPWGIWKCKKVLYVGNTGDGRINAFCAKSGELITPLSNKFGNPITIDGLWGITGDVEFKKEYFDNNNCYKRCNTECEDDIQCIEFAFAAGIEDNSRGLVGYLVDAECYDK